MVEFDFFPTDSVMAFLAFRAIAPLMDVIQLVAGKALHGCFDIALSDVTTGAVRLFMRAEEWELGFVVVVVNVAPVLLIMTTFAVIIDFAHGSGFMRAGVGMTTIAGMWCLRIFFTGFMAVNTTCLAVLPA